MTGPDAGWVEAERAYRYRRTPERRVQACDAAVDFVNEVGFAFFWPIKGIEMPNLLHAIAGRIRDVPDAHDDPDGSRCWDWKDTLLGARRWYYAKVLRRRATLVSLDLLPTFYALSPNYGDYEADYLEAYKDGELSAEAKVIYEALLSEGPLHTVELRRAARLAADSAKSRFERALVELQVRLMVQPTGVAEAGAWRYAFVYDIVARHHPDLPLRARALTRAEARQTLIRVYLDNVVAATAAQVGQVFHIYSWTRRERERTFAALQEAGAIREMSIEGLKGKHWVSVGALEGRD
ncbi:MAG: hypothetical protein JXB47_13005 [Anaerolineae bacterium]|nr:hypothetical protein [Anaerolineae bacterium]